jgi:enoyl-CoA hydratase/carnithine racemase
MGTIHLQRPADHVVLIEIDNPPMNTMGRAMRQLFIEHLDALESDFETRALIVTGRGRAFCSGDDLKEKRKAAASADESSELPANLSAFGDLLSRVESFRAPIIAAINGWCVGGGLELAVCCDIRIASRSAQFVCAGVNVGLMASAYRLPRLIGIGRAKAMLLTGAPQDAETAESFGLVTELYRSEELMDAALTLAKRIASRAPLSVEATKRMAGLAIDLSPPDAVEVQARELGALARSSDHAEALQAFREKREPNFTRS